MININDYKNKTIHMIGICGSSMSGLAQMLLSLGFKVQGSDGNESYMQKYLQEYNIPVIIGHKAQNVEGVGLVVYSAAIAENNVERMEAKRQNIPQIERKDLLGALTQSYKNNVCVSGTHGKTTTSGMLAKAMLDCNLNPTVHIGGMVDSIGGSTRVGSHDYFVAEACEFNASFLTMHPTLALVMNIKEDHLDFYRDIEHIKDTFLEFLQLLPQNGIAIGCGDDLNVLEVFSKINQKKYTFGFNDTNDFYATNISFNDLACASFDVMFKGEKQISISLNVAGKVQILDALAVFAACYVMGLNPTDIAKSLNNFEGVHRRFELTGTYDDVEVYHDYGHNPEEMQQVLQTAKIRTKGRLIAVMQPHTYSRVKRLFNDYITCTQDADITLVTDICAAREVDPGDIHSTMLIEQMHKAGINAVYTATFDDCENYLKQNWKAGDLVVTLGCGDINKLNIQLEEHK